MEKQTVLKVDSRLGACRQLIFVDAKPELLFGTLARSKELLSNLGTAYT